MSRPLLQLSRIGKRFGANRVLDAVSFDLFRGEVHLLAGENGAGKSTLIKILAGIHTDYDGTMELEGREVRFASPREANQHGIAVIHQEMSLVGAMSIADNICLGREPARAARCWLDRRKLTARALEVCRELELDLTEQDLERTAEQCSLPLRNCVEIAKALSFDAKILVMDEPTSALGRAEVERLFSIIKALAARGCGIIYISHKMDEIYGIADRITVLRDGRRVGTARVEECPQDQLVRWMIGRDLAQQIPQRSVPVGDMADVPALELRDFTVPNPAPGRPAAVRRVSMSVGVGEILGIAGLQGSGGTELFHGLFGAYGSVCSGSANIAGEAFVPSSPREAIRAGIAFLTNDRRSTGLVPELSVEQNLTLAALAEFSPGGWLCAELERAAALREVGALDIHMASLEQPVGMLSGGNQQKVVLAKWLEMKPKVFLLDEPTRGVDVGAKHEIYQLMYRLASEGRALVMISTELQELLGLCDRILVLHRGTITAEFTREEASPERILAAAMGAPREGIV